jgi:hypothetical protein
VPLLLTLKAIDETRRLADRTYVSGAPVGLGVAETGDRPETAPQIMVADRQIRVGAPAPLDVSSRIEVPSIDIGGCLEQCRDLLMPVAARRGVLLELAAGEDLPAVDVDRKLLRQALYSVLAEMIETCAEGAVVTVSAKTATGRLDCVISVRNRQSGKLWSAAGSKSAFEVAGGLLDRTGGHMSVHAVAGMGDSVIVHLPSSAATEPGRPDASARAPLAKSA